jgi:two-component system sensor histidine kinase MprB
VALRDGALSVRDHGPGVEPNELPLLFDRFFRGAHERERHGSGLGLAIVRQVAEAHGGTVAAANADDGGLLVRLALPAARPAPTPVAIRAP